MIIGGQVYVLGKFEVSHVETTKKYHITIPMRKDDKGRVFGYFTVLSAVNTLPFPVSIDAYTMRVQRTTHSNVRYNGSVSGPSTVNAPPAEVHSINIDLKMNNTLVQMPVTVKDATSQKVETNDYDFTDDGLVTPVVGNIEAIADDLIDYITITEVL